MCLTRKQGEKIRVGNDIRITVIRIEGNRVKLGIDAPETERIVREELLTVGDDGEETCP